MGVIVILQVLYCLNSILKILSSFNIVYGRLNIDFADDNFIQLKRLFEDNSVLRFTYELDANSKLLFIDVLSKRTLFRLSIYRTF